MSTYNDDCMLETQVEHLERAVAYAEDRLDRLQIACKAVLRAWMTQEPSDTLAMPQATIEAFLRLKEEYESVSRCRIDIPGLD